MHEVVVSKFPWVSAILMNIDGLCQLSVYRSVECQYRHRILDPIKEVLANTCHFRKTSELVKDREMRGGRAIREWYDLMKICPGSAITHECCTRTGNLPVIQPIQ